MLAGLLNDTAVEEETTLSSGFKAQNHMVLPYLASCFSSLIPTTFLPFSKPGHANTPGSFSQEFALALSSA